MIGASDKEIVSITYQSQRRDIYVGSGIDAAPCEPFHGNETITHGLDYTPFCSDAASITLLSYQFYDLIRLDNRDTVRGIGHLKSHRRPTEA